MDVDQKIADGIRAKDEKAFELLVDAYGGLIKSIVSRHLSGTMYAEECINDCLLSFWQNMKRFDPRKNTLKNWIGAVCKYRCIDYLRRHYRESCLCPLTEDIPVQESTDIQDLADELLSGLKPRDRQLFYDHYISGKSIVEIAQLTGDSPERLYNRLSIGRRKLRTHFKERECCEK